MIDNETLKQKYEEYSQKYNDESYEKLRLNFVHKYTVDYIQNMTLDQYVSGIKTSTKDIDYHTFCYDIEIGLKNLGSIKGSNAYKFGIFYSTKDNDYRYYPKYGNTIEEAFSNVKNAIIDLIENGNNFTKEEINQSIISPVFKYKILCTYYPERYMNIFNEDHYNEILDYLGISYNKREHLMDKMDRLISWIKNNEILKNCSNLKFTNFYYDCLRTRDSASEEEKHYWIYSVADIWEKCINEGIMAIDYSFINDIRDYNTLEEIQEKCNQIMDDGIKHSNHALACYEFCNAIHNGDIIYAKKDTKTIVGRGIVQGDYVYDLNRKSYQHIRKVKWVNIGE